MIHFDEHIFQMGWFNHQPDYLSLNWWVDLGFQPSRRARVESWTLSAKARRVLQLFDLMMLDEVCWKGAGFGRFDLRLEARKHGMFDMHIDMYTLCTMLQFFLFLPKWNGWNPQEFHYWLTEYVIFNLYCFLIISKENSKLNGCLM